MAESDLGPYFDSLPPVVTIPELVPLFRTSRSTMYEYARQDRLPVPVIRCGRRMFVSKAAIAKVLSAEIELVSSAREASDG